MKKGILIGSIVFVIIATIVACFAISGGVFNPLSSPLKLAVKYYAEGNYEEAILQFDKAIAINNKLPEVYLAKASAEMHLEQEENAIETTLNAIKLMKDENSESNSAIKLLDAIFSNSEYQGTDEIVLWWYDKTYDNEDYAEYREWIETNWSEKYQDRISEIQNNHKPNEKIYESILANYQKAEQNNYEYDYINGETFESVYPNVNAEIAMSGGKPKLHYLVKDLNNDGVSELIIAALNGSNYLIYDIYTYDNGPKHLCDPYSMGYRAIYSLYQDGFIGRKSAGGTGIFGALKEAEEFSKIDMTSTDYYYISPKEYLVMYENGRCDVTTNGKDYSDEISEAEYKDRLSKYKKIENLNWKELSSFVTENTTIQEKPTDSGSSNDVLTEEEAVKLVLEKTKGQYKLALDSEDDNQFVFRQYEDAPGKQTTLNWFYVNKKTREVTSMF